VPVHSKQLHPAQCFHVADAASRGGCASPRWGRARWADRCRRALVAAANPYLLGAGCHRYVQIQPCGAHRSSLKVAFAFTLTLGARLNSRRATLLDSLARSTYPPTLQHHLFLITPQNFQHHGRLDSQRQHGGCPLLCGQVFPPRRLRSRRYTIYHCTVSELTQSSAQGAQGKLLLYRVSCRPSHLFRHGLHHLCQL
jgi:hypothetical protein